MNGVGLGVIGAILAATHLTQVGALLLLLILERLPHEHGAAVDSLHQHADLGAARALRTVLRLSHKRLLLLYRLVVGRPGATALTQLRKTRELRLKSCRERKSHADVFVLILFLLCLICRFFGFFLHIDL